MSKINEQMWYNPIYFKHEKSGKITLLGHIYRIYKTEKGVVSLINKTDGWEFNSEQELVDFVKKNKMKELPSDADGNPQYVPDVIKKKIARLKETA